MQLQLHKQTTLSVMPWCLHMKAGRLQQLAPCGLERLQVTLLYQHNLHKAVSCHSLKIAQCARFTGLRPSAELGSRHRSSGPKQSINLMSSAAASSKASILFMAKLICKQSRACSFIALPGTAQRTSKLQCVLSTLQVAQDTLQVCFQGLSVSITC